MPVFQKDEATFKTITDTATGEVQQIYEEKSTMHSEKSDEPMFIKLYLDHIAIFNGTPVGINPILAELLKRTTYADEAEPHQIVVNLSVKKRIAEKLGYKNTKTIDNAITEFVRAQYIKRIDRGLYQINPYFFGKGSWKDIKKLRASFDYINGTMTIEAESEEEQHNE